jgi:hypothetical protein
MPLPASYLIPNYFILFRFCVALHPLGGEKKKRKDSAESDDTASMIRGGGYIGARARQPPTAQTIKNKIMWVRGVVCRSTQTQTLTVVACVILQCIPCFIECRCMSDGVLIQFVCQVFNLMVVQIRVCQRFVCIVFVDSPHKSNEDHVELEFPISLSV